MKQVIVACAPTSQCQHNRTGEDNADSHMKRQLMGHEVVVVITKGKLDLGPREQIFYGEFDGRRRKQVLVKIIRSRSAGLPTRRVGKQSQIRAGCGDRRSTRGSFRHFFSDPLYSLSAV